MLCSRKTLKLSKVKKETASDATKTAEVTKQTDKVSHKQRKMLQEDGPGRSFINPHQDAGKSATKQTKF